VQFLLQPLHSSLIAAFNGNTSRDRPLTTRSLSPFVVRPKHAAEGLLRYSSFISGRAARHPQIETAL